MLAKHWPPAARMLPQLLVSMKSLAFAPESVMGVMLKDRLQGLDIVRVFGPALVPIG